MRYSSSYLYEIEEIDASLSYLKVICYKISKAKLLLNKLVRECNMNDIHRINCVKNAIEFNENLLLECGYKSTELPMIIKKHSKLD